MQRLIFAFVLTALLSASAFAHVSLIKGFENTPQNFRLEKVAGSVYVLFGSGGNIGVSYGKDGLMTVTGR